ncbi:Hsp70 family protein [Verrucomicrobia bacterium]|jgi:molecular chaperone DnaK (HSP70)|nr:Hsp70 family protein [Verrucomicrobiota bacterium]MDA7510170.1 Hsp70 family protein [Verrucomicrobiota bacterium]MDA7866873.1 Hsp70 family protein [Verrucomicrobiota bacterium]
MSASHSLGIDLGTSNCALAEACLDGNEVEVVATTQLVGAGKLDSGSGLPSACYLTHPEEFPEAALALPWTNDTAHQCVVGRFANDHGAQVPDRLVTSAKSWLSNHHIDPRSAILPWKSTIAEDKLSPLEVSKRYLVHLKESLLHGKSESDHGRNIEDYTIVLTVPASFDEGARNLTLEAAREAGLGEVTLLEEPQAAFYAWTDQSGSDWRSQVKPGDVVLVCDVGGGTADFSLMAITEQEGNLAIERICVGEHILLGGDNMDLALAYTLRAQLEGEGKPLDEWQFLYLVHSARLAKVALFDNESLAEAAISIPSRGSSLMAGSIATKLRRETLENVVLDGFFATTSVTDLPTESRGSGLAEFGLPYAADPVISKHLARFLTRSLENVRSSEALRRLIRDQAMIDGQSYLRPTAVLFNGGVFKAPSIRQRVLDLLSGWGSGEGVRELTGAEPDLAVARGAAAFGRIRSTGQGFRIKAGAARSYYIGLESSMPAIPGFTPPVKALCVVPQGMEEGSHCVIENQEFGLMVGQPAEFRFFASEVRSGDHSGDIVNDAVSNLTESPAVTVSLAGTENHKAGDMLPVRLQAEITELGHLELWMHHEPSGQRWKLDHQVRLS